MEFLFINFWYILAFFLGIFILRKRRKKGLTKPIETLVIGHRGAAGYSFENSLPSYKKAISIGVDLIEADLRKSKDGIFILSHNNQVKGKKNSKYKISESSASFLKNLVFPRKNQLIFLSDLINELDSKQKVLIDLKITGCEFELLSFLRERNLINRVFISSHFAKSLRLLKVLEPRLIVGISFPRDRFSTTFKIFLSPIWLPIIVLLKHTYPFYVGLLCSYARADFLSVNFRLLTGRLVKAAHKRDLFVYPFSVNRYKDIKKMLKLGVDGIISDYPDRVKNIINSY